MAKETKRLTVKGTLSVEDNTITETDKDLGDIVHRVSDILERFDGDEVSLSISRDITIEGEIQ